MKKSLLFIMALMMGVTVFAADNAKKVKFSVGAGFNIGAMTPLGLPAAIRSIDSYQPTVNLSLGGYASKLLSDKWGLGAGVVFENKGMKTGIETRNYHLTMNITSGDDTGTKTGYFTGKIKNKTKVTYLTIPIYAVFRPDADWEFTGGAYVAFALDRSFIGTVSSGTMRETPLHAAIGINSAEYNYSTDIRRFDTGLALSASRRVYRSLGVKAGLQWGLLSVLDPSTRKVDMDTYNIYLNLGIVYNL